MNYIDSKFSFPNRSRMQAADHEGRSPVEQVRYKTTENSPSLNGQIQEFTASMTVRGTHLAHGLSPAFNEADSLNTHSTLTPKLVDPLLLYKLKRGSLDEACPVCRVRPDWSDGAGLGEVGDPV